MSDATSKYSMIAAVLALLIVVLSHVYLLRLGIACDQFLTFWLPISTMGFLAFYATFTFKSKFPLILIFIFSLTLHLIQFVRQPANMVWNPDAIYALQLVNHVNKTGNWNFGYGTGEALGYSYYPLFYIFQWTLSSVLSISPMLCIKYSMAILNLLTLLTFYLLVNGLFDLDVKSKNLIVFMFSLNPIFHAFDSYAHAESYAVILYPLILLYVLKQRNSNRSTERSIAVMAILLLITVSMSHHFTSYMTALSLLIPALLLCFRSRRFVDKNKLHILALILPLTWLIFSAPLIFTSHFRSLLNVATELTFIHELVGYTVSTAGLANPSLIYYPSEFSMQITLLRTLVLAFFTFIGLLYYPFRNKERARDFKVLLLLYSGLTFLLLFCVSWTQITIPDVRDRIVAFSYFFISFFSSLGIIVTEKKVKIISKLTKNRLIRKRFMKLVLASVFIIIFVPSTIFNAFPRFMYDQTYSSLTCSEFSVAPEQQYNLGLWTHMYVNSSEKTVFTGSLAAHRYVIGYGLFEGSWSKETFNTTLIEILSNIRHTIFCVVNEYNLQLPDHLGRKLDAATIQFLNRDFGRVYDNGIIRVYYKYYENDSLRADNETE